MQTPNGTVERDRLLGSIRGFAASTAPHVQRWAPYGEWR